MMLDRLLPTFWLKKKAARAYADGRMVRAAQMYRCLLDRNADDPTAWVNSGLVHHAQGNTSEASALLQTAVKRWPKDMGVRANLAALHLDQRDPAMALNVLDPILSEPDAPASVWINAARAYQATGRTGEAIRALEYAVAADPSCMAAWRPLARLYKNRPDYARAITAYEAILAYEPDDPTALNNLGTTLRAAGRLAESQDVLARLFDVAPAFSEGHSNWVFGHHYLPEVPPDQIAKAHARFDALHGAKARPAHTFPNPRDPDRVLKIGYVTGDLHRHPVGYFLTPVFSHHDPRAVEVHVFSTRSISDDLNAHLRGFCPNWHEVSGLSGRAINGRIRAAGVDILIDLAGHTGHNAMPVFARRAAPVQVTWAGYVGSTGLAQMDWLLADQYHCPPDMLGNGPEKIYRLPDGYVCFDPLSETPDVAPLPALQNSFVTFGSFNVFEKINPAVVACWAKILNAVPGSRLKLHARALDDPQVSKHLTAAFEAHGIAPDRIDARGRLPHADLLAAYAEVDIALDPFPYSGGMTTLEALWMGVPVMTRADGNRFAGRHSYAHLSVAELPECVAKDEASYRELAVMMATDLESLSALRSRLRARIQASPLRDGPAFTRHLEAAYQHMWQNYCARTA